MEVLRPSTYCSNTRKTISWVAGLSGFLVMVILLLGLESCIEGKSSYSKLPPGPWRGVLHLDGDLRSTGLNELEGHRVKPVFRGIDEMKLPFNFQVSYPQKDSIHLTIRNGDERILLTDIRIGRDRSIAKDTVLIRFPVYDTHIWAKYNEGVMQGYWSVPWRGNYRIPFTATFGENHRFIKLNQEQASNFDGRWNVSFGQGESTWPAIGIFEQNNKGVTGTFRTETGDYRFLSGDAVQDELWLSTFDGTHAYLFHAKMQRDSSLTGTYRSGKHYTTSWTAVRDTGMILSDPDSMTLIDDPMEPLHLSFPSTSGQRVTLSDSNFRGKAVLVQVMGSWCPNCRDETEFLKEYIQEQGPEKLEILSVAFERYRDSSRAMRTLRRYKDAMGITWPVLYGGYFDKSVASESFPRLNRIASYPTLVFLDKKHRVRYIHTGFNGPATDQYEAFVDTFESKVNLITGN